MTALIGLAFLVGAIALLFLCGAVAVAVFHRMVDVRSVGRAGRTPLGRLLDTAFRRR